MPVKPYKHDLETIDTEGRRDDHPEYRIAKAMTERVEALVEVMTAVAEQMAIQNGHLAVIAQMGLKLDALAEATKTLKF